MQDARWSGSVKETFPDIMAADLMRVLNILIVDSAFDVRRDIRVFFEQDGHRVTDVENVAQAIAVLSERAFSLVITDLYMPRMDGIDLLRFIPRSGLPLPKIIAMTTESLHSRESTWSAATLLGARYVLWKPFTEGDLRRAIAAVEKSGTLREPSPA